MYALKHAFKLPRCVQVEWEDGLLARFNYLWLQDNSAKRPSLVHLDLNTTPEAVKCSRNSLNLVWPPFTASDYSSEFLRENALAVAQRAKEINKTFDRPSTSTATCPTIYMSSQPVERRPLRLQSHVQPSSSSATSVIRVGATQRVTANTYIQLEKEQVMSGASSNEEEIWALVDAAATDSRFAMGRTYWGSTAREPGTVWSHLPRVPTICAVDVLSGGAGGAPAVVSVVDAYRALSTLAQRHPEAFDFLSQHMLEYSEDIFKARHTACHRTVDGEIIPGVFNNATRSTKLIDGPLEQLYESLQKLGRICAESTRFIYLPVGKRLLIDNTKAMLGAPTQAGRRLMLRCIS